MAACCAAVASRVEPVITGCSPGAGPEPAFAGVDPYNFYIDRNSDDNVKDVTVS